MYFPQEHPPGREAQLDFTHCNSLGVTIGGRPYRHLLFQLVLSHSGWRYAEVVANTHPTSTLSGFSARSSVPLSLTTYTTQGPIHALRASDAPAAGIPAMSRGPVPRPAVSSACKLT